MGISSFALLWRSGIYRNRVYIHKSTGWKPKLWITGGPVAVTKHGPVSGIAREHGTGNSQDLDEYSPGLVGVHVLTALLPEAEANDLLFVRSGVVDQQPPALVDLVAQPGYFPLTQHN